MDSEELDFIEDQVSANELLFCQRCRQEILHGHLEVLETYPQATELLMQCTHCHTTQVWLEQR